MSNIPPALRDRIAGTGIELEKNKVGAAVEPKPAAAYSRKVKRGRIGAIIEAHCFSKQSWTMFDIRFMRGLALDIITKGRLKKLWVRTLHT